MLALILAFLVAIADFGCLVAGKEHYLCDAFVGVNSGRQWRRVGDFERHIPFPFGLEGRDVGDDAATGIGAFAHGERQHIARNAKVLDAAGEREGVGRHDADVSFKFHEAPRIKGLRIHNSTEHVRENLEFARDSHVVAIGADAIGDDTLAHLAVFEWFDHAVVARHARDPAIVAKPHNQSWMKNERAVASGSQRARHPREAAVS